MPRRKRTSEAGTLPVYAIWASAETGLPLQIDITNERLLGQGKVTIEGFEFDVDVPAPQLGMAGFMPGQWKWSLSEDQLVDALQGWVERHDGQFPACLTHQAWFYNTPDFLQDYGASREDRRKMLTLNARVLVGGILFPGQLPAGDDWTYHGNGMTFDPGDNETPICRYRPEGSETYRVIYRDLSVGDQDESSEGQTLP